MEESKEQILDRIKEERAKLDFKVEIDGIYALPAPWKEINPDDESAPPFSYEINLLGMEFREGKLTPK